MKILLSTLNSQYVHSNLAIRYLYTVIVNEDVECDMREFSINNDGAKIDKKDLDKIWDIFYTTDKARTDRMSSSGVGLSVVNSILDVHKADYRCVSSDNGTEFKFSMPAHETD